jgi:hypothetical protein
VNMHFLWRGMTARPVKDLKVRSSLVRRLVQAHDDPAKHRIRAWLCDLNDEQLSSLGCTSEDIAVLRGRQRSNSRRRERASNKQLPWRNPFRDRPQEYHPTSVSQTGRRRARK